MSARSKPRIRPATVADVPAIVDHWIDFMRDHNRRYFRSVRLTRHNREAMGKHLTDLVGLGQVLVLDLAGAVKGFAAIVANPPRLDLHFASATISDLYVAPDLRGQGWGRALLKAAVDLVAERGLHAVTITALQANKPARALYRSAGFRPQTETLILPLDPEFVQFGREATE